MGIIDEFKSFAMRGNVIDLAVGFTVGAAFSTVARSLVDDIILPPVSLILGDNRFVNMFLVLDTGDPAIAERPYETLEQAEAAGAVTLNYGLFLNNIITFLLIALAMFLLIMMINRLDKQLEEELGPEEEGAAPTPANKKCPYCLTTIPYKASRCPNCTSQLEASTKSAPA